MGLSAVEARPEGAEVFFKVPASLYRPGEIIEEDLYFLYQGQYVLYRLKNLIWKEEDDKRLKEFKLEDLYMKFSGKQDYAQFIETHLSKVLDDRRIPEKKKAELLYSTSTTLVQDLFSASGSSENFKRSLKTVKNTIHFLGKEKENFFHLMGMATKDFSEYSHAVHTAAYAIALAGQLGIKAFNQISALGTAAMLHDIGKTKIDRHIVNKKGPLDEAERIEIEKHPVYSFEIVKSSRSVPDLSETVILQHHERPNGRGYPYHLKDEIHLFSKILSIADCFDSLTSDRNHQASIKPLEAIERMRTDLKDEYDQKLLVEFIRMLKR